MAPASLDGDKGGYLDEVLEKVEGGAHDGRVGVTERAPDLLVKVVDAGGRQQEKAQKRHHRLLAHHSPAIAGEWLASP